MAFVFQQSLFRTQKEVFCVSFQFKDVFREDYIIIKKLSSYSRLLKGIVQPILSSFMLFTLSANPIICASDWTLI